MEPIALLNHARQAGLVVLQEGDRLVVRGPKRLRDLAAQLLDRKADVLAALQAETAAVTAESHGSAPAAVVAVPDPDSMVTSESDPDVAVALDVFAGAQVVAVNQAAVWPPEGCWIPSSASTIDIYATEMPTVPCPCCGATAWRRAGSGWCCSRCHPDPRAVRSTRARPNMSETKVQVREPAAPTLATAAGTWSYERREPLSAATAEILSTDIVRRRR